MVHSAPKTQNIEDLCFNSESVYYFYCYYFPQKLHQYFKISALPPAQVTHAQLKLPIYPCTT